MTDDKLIRRTHKEIAALTAQRADLAARVDALTEEIAELTETRDAMRAEVDAFKRKFVAA